MKQTSKKIKSTVLGESLNVIVYGEKGYPVIVFQTQDQKADDFEKGGMVEELASYIEDGKLQLFSVDNIDEESWSNTAASNEDRIARQEQYFQFVADELLTFVHKTNGSEVRPLVMGCSMGAVHAAIAFMRRPDLFEGNVSLSGVYNTGYFFGDWMNGTSYANDVLASLSGMPANHPYVDLYNQRSILFCTGAGLGEEGYADTQRVDQELTRLGVDHWCDFWGNDVEHNFAWWKKQIAYFMPFVLEDIEKHQPGVLETLAAAPVKKAATKKKPAAKKAATKKAAEPVVEAEPVKAAEAVVAAEPVAAKAEAKPAKKAAAPKKAAAKKAEPKAAAKAAVKAEPVVETKVEATEVKPAEAKPATKKAATKTAAKPVAKATAKKAEPVVEAKPAVEEKAAKAPAKKAAATKAAKTTKKATEPVVETKAAEAVAEPVVEAKSAAKKAAAKPAAKKTVAKKDEPKAEAKAPVVEAKVVEAEVKAAAEPKATKAAETKKAPAKKTVAKAKPAAKKATKKASKSK